MILAAGMGSRYGGLKQIDPVGPSGERVIDYSIYDAIRAGFKKVVFVIRRDIEEAFREAIGHVWENRIDCEYAFQDLDDVPAGFSDESGRSKPWGTAHAIRAGRLLISTPFAAINADDFYGYESFQALSSCLSAMNPAASNHAMVAFRLDQTLSENGHVSRGVCLCDDAGKLRQIREYTHIVRDSSGEIWDRPPNGAECRLAGSESVSMNCWGFSPTIFHELETDFADFLKTDGGNPKAEFTIPAVVDTAIRTGRGTVEVLVSPARWFGVTYKDDKEMVVRQIQALVDAGVYPQKI